MSPTSAVLVRNSTRRGLVGWLAIAASVALASAQEPYPLFTSEAANPPLEHVLPSHVSGEKRRLIVQLPADYQDDGRERYPVLYLLDGDRQLKHTVMTLQNLVERRKMPPTIIVALPNVSEDA